MAAPSPSRLAPAPVAHEELLARVRYNGAYATREHAERVVATVLTAFGPLLPDAGRERLAARLPAAAAAHLRAGGPAAEAPTGWGFVKALADRTGQARATTRWDVGTVLMTVGRLVGDGLVAELLRDLPEGYALLFGKAEPARPKAA